jgi:hypothetical protein
MQLRLIHRSRRVACFAIYTHAGNHERDKLSTPSLPERARPVHALGSAERLGIRLFFLSSGCSCRTAEFSRDRRIGFSLPQDRAFQPEPPPVIAQTGSIPGYPHSGGRFGSLTTAGIGPRNAGASQDESGPSKRVAPHPPNTSPSAPAPVRCPWVFYHLARLRRLHPHLPHRCSGPCPSTAAEPLWE